MSLPKPDAPFGWGRRAGNALLGLHRFDSLVAMTLDRGDRLLARRLRRDLRASGAAVPGQADVEAYEDAFAKWNGSRGAVSFIAGRVALAACVDAIGLEPGDEVIMPGYTCTVVPNAFENAGVAPVYCDIELDTFGPDFDSMTRRVTPRTKAVLLQHLYGIPARDTRRIVDWARQRRLWVIEDCAQSTGAAVDGTRIGNFGDLAIYSSEVSKAFTTVQGGVATSNDPVLVERLRTYQAGLPPVPPERVDRLLAMVDLLWKRYRTLRPRRREKRFQRYFDAHAVISTLDDEHEGGAPSQGYHPLPAPLAVLGLRQLGKLDALNARRRANARRIEAWCTRQGFQVPRPGRGAEPVYVRYPVLVPPERKVKRRWAVSEVGVLPGDWFRSNLHPGNRPVEGCPNADEAVARCINFPGLLKPWARFKN